VRFLVDENLPPRLCGFLTAEGMPLSLQGRRTEPSVILVRELLSLPGASQGPIACGQP
jgi:hypothetical protein